MESSGIPEVHETSWWFTSSFRSELSALHGLRTITLQMILFANIYKYLLKLYIYNRCNIHTHVWEETQLILIKYTIQVWAEGRSWTCE